MSNPVVIRYPLDLTGHHPDNLVIGESHGPCYPGNRVFVLSYGPFYAKSLVIRNKTTGVALTPNVDYKAVHTFIEPTLMTGLLVCSIIQIEASAYGIELDCDYQVLGGDYSLSTSALENLVQDLNEDDRPVRWGEIIGKPVAFPPTPHLHDIYDVFGWQYVVAALEAIRQAMLLGSQGNNDDLYAYVDLKFGQAMAAIDDVEEDMNAHINNFNNPHQVTKEQIGLGLVGNYPLATPEIARLGLSHNTLMTPYLIKYANEYHTLDFNNPHQVTKGQTGLGNVDNYITATLEMALAGVDNQSFLTPYGAAAMIAAAISATPPTPQNPPTANFYFNNNQQSKYPEDFTYNAAGSYVGSGGTHAVIQLYIGNNSTQPAGQTITGSVWTVDDVAWPAGPAVGDAVNYNVYLPKPAGAGQSTQTTKVFKLVVTNSASLTSTKTSSIIFRVTLELQPPTELMSGYGKTPIRINGLMLHPNASYQPERYQSKITAAVGQTRTHTFNLDIDPYWVGWSSWPDYEHEESDPHTGWTADGEVKADHRVNWLVTNDYTHSAITYLNNVQGYNVSYNVDVQSTYWKAMKGVVTVTSLITGLSTSATFYMDARTLPDYVEPTADFEYDVSSATGFTVTKPAYHDLRFIDRSLSNVVGEDLEEVVWQINSAADIVSGSTNTAPGGWLHVRTGRYNDTYGGDINFLPAGTTVLTVSLSTRRANSAWVTKTSNFNLITNNAAVAAPSFNLDSAQFSYTTSTGLYRVDVFNAFSGSPSSGAGKIASVTWNITSNFGFTRSGTEGTSWLDVDETFAHAFSSGHTITLSATVTNAGGISTTVNRTWNAVAT